jgi:hypothetical protein
VAARLRVVADELAGGEADLPAAPGAWRGAGAGIVFVPRFPFVAGRRYAVVLDGDVLGRVERPGAPGPSPVVVAAAYPSGGTVPRNLLRLYVCFTGRMSEGPAGSARIDGAPGAFLPMAEELWDPTRTRLTLLLDPARIKRGLVAHAALGYPLQEGSQVRLVVDGMRDAGGAPVEPWSTAWAVGPDLRHRLDPAQWRVSSPRAGTRDRVTVSFGRPLDHALLQRALTPPVPGVSEIGAAEQSWSFVPDRPWPPGDHAIVVDTVLEDVAGNSLRRAFDRDLADPRDDPCDAGELRLGVHVVG